MTPYNRMLESDVNTFLQECDKEIDEMIDERLSNSKTTYYTIKCRTKYMLKPPTSNKRSRKRPVSFPPCATQSQSSLLKGRSRRTYVGSAEYNDAMARKYPSIFTSTDTNSRITRLESSLREKRKKKLDFDKEEIPKKTPPEQTETDSESENESTSVTVIDLSEDQKESSSVIDENETTEKQELSKSLKKELDMLRPQSLRTLPPLFNRSSLNSSEEIEDDRISKDTPQQTDDIRPLSDMFSDLGFCRYLRRSGTDIEELRTEEIFQN